MPNIKNKPMAIENEVLSPEEQKAEQEALAEKKEDEVRASIISDLGFDEVSDADKIDKLVAKEMENHKKLSTAIGQKIKHRTTADELRKKVPMENTQKKGENLSDEDLQKKIGEGVTATLEQRDLEALEYSDELKAEIKKVAQIQGVSIKKALSDPYVQAKITQYKRDVEAEGASVRQKGGKGGSTSFKVNDPPDVDMSTEDGRKKYEEWKSWAKKQG